ncbi:hypothetical protein Daus18300_006299 [Diaporthe australafricana]|uniref:LPXTG-domain-containing protein n=1 Tax=Diaporthe australafricana TaxID=127596 RepID=A0ABR3WUY1_9PEZI
MTSLLMPNLTSAQDNLRFASATCLFDYPKHRANSTASCDLDTACKPIQTAVETGLTTQAEAGDYLYCSADDSAFHGSNVNDCVTCLQSSSSSYVANFLVALQAGCEQQPAPGVLLGLSGEIFSEHPVDITSAASNSTAATKGNDRAELSTAGIVGIAIGATALFVIAIILFTIYWCRQRRYEREDKMTAEHSAFYSSKEPGSGSYMASITSANSSRPVPSFTTDHRPPPPSYAPPGAVGLEMDIMNNAEYYDRMEGKVRGRPLAAPSSSAKKTQPESISSSIINSEAFDSASHVDTAVLPTHPAYIARDHRAAGTGSRLGGRASRNSTPSLRSEPRFARPDNNYTVQVYMDSLGEAKDGPRADQQPQPQPPQGPRPDGIVRDVGITREVGIDRDTSQRSIQIELAGPPEVSSSRPSISDSIALRQGGGRVTPIPPPQGGRTTPVPPQGGRTTPLPPSSSSQCGGRITPAPAGPSPPLSSSSSSPEPDTFGTGTGMAPPRIPSLILPRIRVPSKKPPKLVITGASPVEDITGPLAFPDSRFSTRPPPPPPPPGSQQQDRIIEQMVDRAAVAGRPGVDVPIGSGKSYLYG